MDEPQQLNHVFSELEQTLKKFVLVKNQQINQHKKNANIFSKEKILKFSMDLLSSFCKQKKIVLFYKYFAYYLGANFKKTCEKDLAVLALNYLQSLIKHSESSEEIKFILNLFEMKTSCFIHAKCYLKAKKLILEELFANNYGVKCLDSIKLKIDQWVAVINKLFSNYDAKYFINIINEKITNSSLYKKKIDSLDSLVFIEYCIEEFLNLEQFPPKNQNQIEEKKTAYDHKFIRNNEHSNEQNDKNMSILNSSDQNYSFEKLRNELEREKFQKSQIQEENQILQAFLEDIMMGYNKLLSYTYELEKAVGMKKGMVNKDNFIRDIEKLSNNEELKDYKGLQKLCQNIKNLLKNESLEEIPMLCSTMLTSLRENQVPEVYPEDSEFL